MIHYHFFDVLRVLMIGHWWPNTVYRGIGCESEAFPVVHEAINEWIEDKLKIIQEH